jgi:acetyl esterase/lipase
MLRRTFLCAGAAAVAAPAFGQTPRTIRYAQTPGAAPGLQSLDIYPHPDGPRRIVAFVHGGGWRIGDKATASAGAPKAQFFHAQGYAYASLNYRLSPDVMHPAHVEDVAAALAWLLRHGAREGCDPKSLVVMGHSAGAHLAALVATDHRRLAGHGFDLSHLGGAILLDGAGYDVARQMRTLSARDTGFTKDMYAAAFGQDPAVQADASPITHVAGGKGIAPFLIVHTSRLASTLQSRALAQRLQSAGVPADLLAAPGHSHADVNRRIGEPGEMISAGIIDFLTRRAPAAAAAG